MRLGIRLQIALSLGVLLVLAFVPLFAAVSGLTRATLLRVSDASLLTLAQVVVRHAELARATAGAVDLHARLRTETAAPGPTLALGLYDAQGQALVRVGRDHDDAAAFGLESSLETRALGQRSAVLTRFPTPRGAAVRVVVPSVGGGWAVVVLARDHDEARQPIPLLRLVGLYGVLFAIGLLVFSYIALTRLIVRPLDAISTAAGRVASGARRFEPTLLGPAELEDLAVSLTEMTARLKADEHSMRQQIVELEERARALREAQDQLVRSERLASVGRLAAGLAHEIGNPLAALIGLEDLLIAGGSSPAEERDFLLRIRSETERIHRVLRHLLDFARPASSSVVAPEPPGSVCEAIQDVVALVQPQPAFRHFEIQVRAPTDLPSVALGKERIMQVLLNLMLNAADAARRGTICVEADRVDDVVRIAVTDDGPGVDSKVAARLFEPFVTTKEVGQGTGLGLAVCRGLVEAVRGTVHFDEAHRPGARFVVTLPLAAPTDC